MTRSKLAIAFYLLLVFLSGVLVGFFGYRLYTAASVSATSPRTPEEYRQRYLAEMKSRLGLNDPQVRELNSILDETRAQYREFREKHKAETKAIEDHRIERINALLNDAQRAEYQKMRQEREKHSKGHSGGR